MQLVASDLIVIKLNNLILNYNLRVIMKYIIFLVLIIPSLVGCATSSRSDFTALSSKNINLANVKANKSMVKGNTKGEDCQHTVLFIPLSGPATLDEALDRALELRSGNLLLNGVVEHSWYYVFLPFYGRDCWKVSGVAYDTYK